MSQFSKVFFSPYTAISLGVIIGLGFVKISGDAMDRNVLKTCHPTKIYSYNNTFFGERLFCK